MEREPACESQLVVLSTTALHTKRFIPALRLASFPYTHTHAHSQALSPFPFERAWEGPYSKAVFPTEQMLNWAASNIAIE